jgi:hypothetical protein
LATGAFAGYRNGGELVSGTSPLIVVPGLAGMGPPAATTEATLEDCEHAVRASASGAAKKLRVELM